jgi:hypothetical protein
LCPPHDLVAHQLAFRLGCRQSIDKLANVVCKIVVALVGETTAHGVPAVLDLMPCFD